MFFAIFWTAYIPIGVVLASIVCRSKSRCSSSCPSTVRCLRRSNGVRRLSAIIAVCAALSTTTGLAHAGACVDQLTTLQQAPQLSHQLMSESVSRAETYAQLMLSADLARAETLDAQGNEEKCRLAARRAKHESEERAETTALIPPSVSRGGS